MADFVIAVESGGVPGSCHTDSDNRNALARQRSAMAFIDS